MNAADIDHICLKCMQPGLSGGICAHCGTRSGFTQEPAFALPAGSILHGRYLVGAVLGNGGFGITYIGYDLKEDRRVAIKEFLPTGMANRYPGTTTVSVYHTSQEFYYGLKKFLEEARVIYKYRAYSNIISVYALFEENNTAYYVMEYLEGCDLKQYLSKRGGVLPFEETLQLLLPVFDALTAIHKDGLIHRDISPDNIYICSNGQVKLLDFGAARVALMEKSKSLSVILKRGYAPPEQYQTNGNQGPWTDVYALGATFYRCIAGKLPPEATERLVTDTMIPPARLLKDVPPAANDAMLRALAVKAPNRFQSAAQFKAALTQPHPVSGTNVPRDIPAPQISTNPKNEARGTIMNTKVLGKRFLAYLLDSLIVGAAGLILLSILGVSSGVYVMLTYAICVGYGSVLEYSPSRATLGKRALHLRVGDADGQPVPNNKILIRNLVKYCPTLGLFIPGGMYLPALAALVIFGYALFDANRQAVHDKAAGTYVTEAVPGYAPAQQPYAQQAQPAAAPARRISLQGTKGHYFGVEFPVGEAVVLGRNPNGCGIVFPNDAPGVSGVHCEVRLDRASHTVQLTDKNSSYGTFMNGRKLVPGQPVILHNGDTFTIGEDNAFAVVIQ